jgi:putative PIN family toxin of toxin-antitoxin system
MSIVILDTSALIVAITGARNFTQDLLLLAQQGCIKIVASQETLEEFKNSLEYPKIKKIIKPHLEYFLEIFWDNVQIVDIPRKHKSLTAGTTEDPKDDIFIALAEHIQANYLVSLDRKHLVVLKKWRNTSIVLPYMAVLGIAEGYGFKWNREQDLSSWWQKTKSKIISSNSLSGFSSHN